MKWWECVCVRERERCISHNVWLWFSIRPNCNDPISQLFILSFYPSLSYALHFRSFSALQTSNLVYTFWFGSLNQLASMYIPLFRTTKFLFMDMGPFTLLTVHPPPNFTFNSSRFHSFFSNQLFK